MATSDEKMLSSILKAVSEKCGDSEKSMEKFRELIKDENKEWKMVLMNWINHQPLIDHWGLYNEIYSFEKVGTFVVYTVCIGTRKRFYRDTESWTECIVGRTDVFYIARDHYLLSVAVHKQLGC